MSKIESGKLELHVEACNVAGLVRGVATSFAIYANNKGIELTCSCPPEEDVPLVMLDKIRVRQTGTAAMGGNR